MKTNDKPLTEICGICKNKIHLDRGLGWADLGPPRKPEFSVHVECLGLGPTIEDIQDNIRKKIRST